MINPPHNNVLSGDECDSLDPTISGDLSTEPRDPSKAGCGTPKVIVCYGEGSVPDVLFKKGWREQDDLL